MNKLQRMLKQIHKSGYTVSCHFSDYGDTGVIRFYGWLHGQQTGNVEKNYCIGLRNEEFKSFDDIVNRALDIICENQVSGKYITT
jgi:hypothetical protein